MGAGFDGEGARVRHGEELVGRAAQVGRVELVHAHHGVAPVLLGERQPVAAPHEGEEEAALLVRVRVRFKVRVRVQGLGLGSRLGLGFRG